CISCRSCLRTGPYLWAGWSFNRKQLTWLASALVAIAERGGDPPTKRLPLRLASLPWLASSPIIHVIVSLASPPTKRLPLRLARTPTAAIIFPCGWRGRPPRQLFSPAVGGDAHRGNYFPLRMERTPTAAIIFACDRRGRRPRLSFTPRVEEDTQS